jgi:PAS domain S-box-containing protein
MKLRELFEVPDQGRESQRQARLLNVLMLGTLAAAGASLLLMLPADLVWHVLAPGESLLLYATFLTLAVAIAFLYWLNRHGQTRLASYLFLLGLVVALSLADQPEQMVNGRSLVVYVLPIIMASVLVRPAASFALAAIVSFVVIILSLWIQISPNVIAVLTFWVVALVAWLSAHSLERALEDLRAINVELDQRVEERTRDLADALARAYAESSKNQAILEGIADGVIVFDNEGKAIVANPAIGRILGIASQDLLGEDIKSMMRPNVALEDSELIAGMLGEGEPLRSGLKFEWGEKTLSVSFAPVRGQLDEVTGTVAVYRDFTREAEIDQMKSDFVSIVSHELRTPLTAIKGYLDLILIGAAGPITQQQQSFLEIAKGNARRLHELVSDLLDLSRIESGRAELDLQVVSLQPVIEQVVDTLRNEFEVRDLALTVDVSQNLPELFGDPLRIAQILTNLLSNAYKYTSTGGVTLRGRQIHGNLQVDIIDTGVGISEDDQDKLFTRFFRARDTIVRQQAGTGLGLNITKSLVELHGGEIWVESAPGKGSTFSFTLPLPAGLVEAQEAKESEPAAAGKEAEAAIPAGPWILVVDDDPEVAQLFQLQLQREGYRVNVVNQGSRALDVARQLQPELITLDLLMDIDGITILKQLKADPVTSGIPVVVVSVVAEPEEGLALGAADYLIKPLDEGELLSCVGRILERDEDGRGDKILVVDDETDIVGWLKLSLNRYGYQVSEAYDGMQALDAVASDKPDLILLDLGMPRMDGRTTIQKLRQQEEGRNIPIIVLSADAVGDEIERAQMAEMGVREFLRKPVALESLVGEVRRHLDRGTEKKASS